MQFLFAAVFIPVCRHMLQLIPAQVLITTAVDLPFGKGEYPH
jgi:hypothetical protein